MHNQLGIRDGSELNNLGICKNCGVTVKPVFKMRKRSPFTCLPPTLGSQHQTAHVKGQCWEMRTGPITSLETHSTGIVGLHFKTFPLPLQMLHPFSKEPLQALQIFLPTRHLVQNASYQKIFKLLTYRGFGLSTIWLPIQKNMAELNSQDSILKGLFGPYKSTMYLPEIQ